MEGESIEVNYDLDGRLVLSYSKKEKKKKRRGRRQGGERVLKGLASRASERKGIRNASGTLGVRRRKNPPRGAPRKDLSRLLPEEIVAACDTSFPYL